MRNALITGASSGIGEHIAYILASRGYNLIIVSRSKEKLSRVKQYVTNRYGVKVKCVATDLSVEANCYKLYELTKNMDPEILINNAGFGVYGNFSESSLEEELNMIDLNVKAVHILTKLYLADMLKENRGHILNVASIAGFAAGPLMSGYYASKNYVYRLTLAIREEVKKQNRDVKICTLCPGPTDTLFNERAKVSFAFGSLDARFVAEKGIEGLFEDKAVIVPGVFFKITAFLEKYFPDRLVAKVAYLAQRKKKAK